MANTRDNPALTPSDQFERLITEVHKIAERATITTTVEPRPLDTSAKEAVAAYNAITQSLRTILETVASRTLPLLKMQP